MKLTENYYFSTIPVNYFFHEIKPQSKPFAIVNIFVLNSVKFFKNSIQLFCFHALPVVRNFNFQMPRMGAEIYRNNRCSIFFYQKAAFVRWSF